MFAQAGVEKGYAKKRIVKNKRISQKYDPVCMEVTIMILKGGDFEAYYLFWGLEGDISFYAPKFDLASRL